jgi:hypothetical protein
MPKGVHKIRSGPKGKDTKDAEKGPKNFDKRERIIRMPDFGVYKEKDTLLVTVFPEGVMVFPEGVMVFPEGVMVGQTRLSP